MTTSTTPWAAPVARGPVSAVVELPGSKSMTNRALILAAHSPDGAVLTGALRSRDTLLMAAALRALGIGVEEDGTTWRVSPGTPTAPASIDCGLSGNVMRFVPPLAALADGPVAFDGDPHARTRPMGPLLGALRDLGVAIDDGGRGLLPFTLRGTGAVAGGTVVLDASSSSQLVSGLLLSAPGYGKGVELRHDGPPVPSAPHLEMTVRMLREAGASVETEPDVWRVAPGALRGGEWKIEPDLSNAAQFLAAALVTDGEVTVRHWPEHTTQPGDRLRDLLALMGGEVSWSAERGLTVRGTGAIHGVDVDLSACSELAQVLAMVAALADSPSRFRGIGHIRGHETDRLAALVTEITRLGGDAEETADGLVIRPRPLHGGLFHTYDDHRMVMAAATLGLAVPGVEVENPATVGKTLPTFTELWTRMLELS
ncbi:3-phosphoshikimate 1-carboxyvinyltransferase [Actinocorallia sp. A-T 12471]|uniref:3-phosphoshikimate 1-carboxyvinyltransferase n=1 Tax=Actinocorallia sp. A-T 12471 TaxID=3089813 RepID=UPI0029D33369|nr:3-phosphoshikimate 1-carboxyvinyltransferase [Actinocorallia sp. A-T 12471]MDX6738875.1 3-phosphoshikimate 1-carboxyvinyltransferase [Actinocorallia sp. A-T 12471]